MIVAYDPNFSKETLLKFINQIRDSLQNLNLSQQEAKNIISKELQNHNEKWKDKSQEALTIVKETTQLVAENLKNALERTNQLNDISLKGETINQYNEQLI